MSTSAMQQRSVWGRALRRWFDPRGRNVGVWGFILFRLSALGLTFYLAAHYVALYNLVRGPDAWASFLALARTPLFKLFDIVVFAGALVHGINGIRVGLLGLGIGAKQQKGGFVISMALTVILLIAATWLFLMKA